VNPRPSSTDVALLRKAESFGIKYGDPAAAALSRLLADYEARGEALEPFARVFPDVEPTPEERNDLESYGFDPLEGIPHDLGPDAPVVGDYLRAVRVLARANGEGEKA